MNLRVDLFVSGCIVIHGTATVLIDALPTMEDG